MNLTTNFLLREFKCHNGNPVPPALVPVTRAFCRDYLEVIREASGGRRVDIVSGYRDPAYNKACRGAADSRHIHGDGADITIDGMTPDEVADLCEQLAAKKLIPKGGIGRYNGWTHVDGRGRIKRWDHRKSGKRG